MINFYKLQGYERTDSIREIRRRQTADRIRRAQNGKARPLRRAFDGAEVILKLDKDHEKGNKIATITLHMPGEDLVACHQSKAFEESVDEAIDALKRQLDKFKSKSEK